jgi:soluble lytic murein transglycosylase
MGQVGTRTIGWVVLGVLALGTAPLLAQEKAGETAVRSKHKATTHQAATKKAGTGKAARDKASTDTGKAVADSHHTGRGKRPVERNGRTRTHRVVLSTGHARSAVVLPKATPESRRLNVAFVASAQLRPMAQQLVMTRSAAAYSGVTAFAAGHPGEAAAAADLAIGHAYMLDRRYTEAEGAFRRAATNGAALADYADYLAAQADVLGGRPADAVPLLEHFAERHPGSLFVGQSPLLLANAYLATGNPASALRVLQPVEGSQGSVDMRSMLAKAYLASGDTGKAAALYRGIYLKDALSPNAVTAKTQLAAMNVPLTPAERKMHADALFNAKQFLDAGMEYRALEKNDSGLSQSDRDALEIYAAVCDLKLKRLSKSDVEKLPVTGDDSAALKLYLQSELARNMGKTDEHDELVATMEARFPQSRWLEEALYSGGNMYLLKQESEKAIEAYSELVKRFPRSTYAPNAHWHAAWLSYRMRRYPDAARLMDEQIVSYPAGTEIPGALYWRGRLYEDQEHNFGQALNYYKTLNATYVNSYYGILARQRMAVIGTGEAVAPAAVLASVRVLDDPGLTDVLPENDPHLIKARLLANAALNEYIRPEIQLSPTAGQWGALAEAEIYQSFGENTRALQAMKRSRIPFFSLPVSAVPMAYWQLVFPRPYWAELEEDAKAHGLDPFLVAALIRQESEFNPDAVSRANAYGLMQLLPSVGKSLAKQEGEKHFSTNELLNPNENLKLGTLDLRKSIDRYNGQVEYALAAYNAGDTPVHQWMTRGDFKDVAEWVESIPYTETRDYVQGILRNRELYRAVYTGK